MDRCVIFGEWLFADESNSNLHQGLLDESCRYTLLMSLPNNKVTTSVTQGIVRCDPATDPVMGLLHGWIGLPASGQPSRDHAFGALPRSFHYRSGADDLSCLCRHLSRITGHSTRNSTQRIFLLKRNHVCTLPVDTAIAMSHGLACFR